MKLCSKESCVGCQACKNICPKDAIEMTHDKMLKTIPEINTAKCVNCGICTSVCPVLQESQYRNPLFCYAAWTTNVDDQKDCASGGIATALSRKMLKDGGRVFGCAYDENLNLDIQAAEIENDLERFKGSKYVQSGTADSYQKVQKLLKEGVKVLYIGTPCQIDGLLHFLKKEYDNLFTVDIICHGVPPIEYLKLYIDELHIRKMITNVTFRGKEDYKLCVYHEDDLEYQEQSFKDLYFRAFQEGLIFRDNCYECQYAGIRRVSDITIGDFWGIDKSTLSVSYDGKISVILVNSAKGKIFLEKCQDLIAFEERELAEAVMHNEQLKRATPRHTDRRIFEDNISKGFTYAVNQTVIGHDIRMIKRSETFSAKVWRRIKKFCHR